MRRRMKCGVFAALAATTLCALAASNRRAPVPGPNGETVVWQAETARQVGVWRRAERADAGGGAYLRPEGWRADGEHALEFEFEAPKPTVLSVYPKWWRHGERRPAVRFPSPLSRSVGPSAVAAVGDAVFFAAPAAGRVGVLDAKTEKPVGQTDMGGYPVDLVADAARELLYVADAAADRVVIVDARKRTVAGEVAVEGMPWSLDLRDRQLFVACLKTNCVTVIDTRARRVTKRIELGSAPRLVRSTEAGIEVLRQPLVLTTDTLTPELPDRFDYFAPGRKVAGFPNPIPTEHADRQPRKQFDAPEPHRIRVRTTGQFIDVKSVTESADPGVPPDEREPTPGPVALDELGEVLLFAAPSAGRVGLVNMDSEALIGAVEVGGYPVDLIADPKREVAHVADAAGNRLVTVEAKTQKVIGALNTPELPVCLALHEDTLYVACRAAKCLAVIDLEARKLVRTVPLPDAPLEVHRVRLYPPYTFFAAGKWPWTYYLPPDSEAPHRILVELPQRVVIDPATLDIQQTTDGPAPDDTHQSVSLSSSVRTAPPRSADTPREGLVAQWGHWADRDAATKCHESLGAVGEGTPTNLTVATDDYFGHVLQFDGRKSKAEWKHSPALMPENGLTVDAWVKWDGPGSSNPDGKPDPSSCLVGKRGPNAGYMLMIRNDGAAFLNLNGLNHQKDLDQGFVHSKAKVPRGRWAHVAGVYDPTGPTMAVYVNGVGQTARPKAPMHPSDVVLGIGSQPGWYWFKGQIAQVRLWSRALSAADVAKLYDAAVPEKTKTFRIDDNSSVLCVDERRWIDVGQVCDPQLMASSSRLGPGDRPGTITFSMDGGPEHDWKRNVWLTPDNEVFLTNETDEFRQWNGVTFDVGSGKHTLRVRAHSPHAALDGIEVVQTLGDRLDVRFVPEPRELHASVPLSSYHGVFYDAEPVRMTVEAHGSVDAPKTMQVAYEVRNFLDEVVFSGKEELSVGEAAGQETPRVSQETPRVSQDPRRAMAWFTVAPELSEWGVFSLRVNVHSEAGTLQRQCWFLRLPKLEHPRLLFRRDQREAIRARLAKHPRLFQRYAEWLLRNHSREGFLPPTLLSKYPSESSYFDVIGKWRAVGCQFARMFLTDEASSAKLRTGVERLLEKGRADQHTFVHNWLRGALPFLYDMAGADSAEVRQQFESLYPDAWLDMNRREESLLALREPLTPAMRASLFQQMRWMVNVDRYFTAHAGARGGNYYQGIHSFCVCPIFGTLGAYALYQNVFGMPRLFERPHFQGWFTHYRYVSPPLGVGNCCARGAVCTGGPKTGKDHTQASTMVRAIAGLTRHPLEKHLDGWDAWLAKADGEAALSDAETDALFDDLGVCIPLFLAWGWYEPEAPEVSPQDLPPTALFDAEGHVSMRTSWAEDATQVLFACGPRDCSDRFRAGHLRILRGNDALLVAPSARRGDHGQPVPSWGNTVVVGDKWQQWWMRSVGHPRGMDERLVINRYAPAVKTYEQRNAAMTTGAVPQNMKDQTYYTLNFHEHVQNPYLREGEIVAYETHPEFDYAAGDMTNAWTCDEVAEAYRQVVFVRPDLIVVYDRLLLPDPAQKGRWLAATPGALTTGGAELTIETGASVLHGRVVLPRNASVKGQSTRDFGESIGMPVAVIEPPAPSRLAEYLVVMQTGNRKEPPSFTAESVPATDETVGVRVRAGDDAVELRFHRAGPPGGSLRLDGAEVQLVDKVDDSYRNWASDPRHREWTREPAFRFLRCQ